MFGSTRTKRLAVAGGAVAAIVAPVVLAAPAQAAVSKDGCTVTAGTPYFDDDFDSHGTKEVKRKITVTCDEDLRVEIRSEFVEQDLEGRAGDGDPDDDLISQGTSTRTFLDGSGRTTQEYTYTRALPQPPFDSDTSAELYHHLRFRVTSGDSGNGVQGSWSAWQFSPVTTIYY